MIKSYSEAIKRESMGYYIGSINGYRQNMES